MAKLTDQQLLEYIKADSKISFDHQSRRHAQWDENYALYRDKVATNRLTQRQAVNLPVMRETVQTWVSKIAEAPKLFFAAKDRTNAGLRAELAFNEVYEHYYRTCALEQVDIMLKKTVGLQGRCFLKLDYSRAKGTFSVVMIDPFDVELDPRTSPFDLETARFLNHKGIFRTLREVLANPSYRKDGKDQLKQYLQTKSGILRIEQTEEARQRRDQRLRDLGVSNFDEFGARDVVVELKECYKLVWHDDEKKFVRHLIVQAMDHAILYDEPVQKALGVGFIPIISWADDPDMNDQWPDGKGDSVRTVAKIINVYVSQLLENRTYRNFGMYFFDSTNQKYRPGAMDPRPFGMYGVPGDPSKVVQQVRIEPLTGTVEEIAFLKNFVQSSVAITPTELGEQQKGDATLGEIELNLTESKGRLNAAAPQYRTFWQRFGYMFYEIMNAKAAGPIRLYKTGADDEVYAKDVYPSDWKTPEGFRVEVTFASDHEAEANDALKRASYVRANFPTNVAAQKIAKRKSLEAIGWSADEIQQVMDAEDQLAAAAEAMPGAAVDPANPAAALPSPFAAAV